MSTHKTSPRTALVLALSFLVLIACGVLSPAATSTPEIVVPPVEPSATTETQATDPTETGDPTTENSPTETENGETEDPDPSSELATVFAPFWEARELLHQYFVNQPVEDEALVQGAIDGITTFTEVSDAAVSAELAQAFSDAADTPAEVEAVFLPFWETWIAAGHPDDTLLMQIALSGLVSSLGDEHTSYLNPDELFQANTPIEGSYEGIGAWVDPDTDDYLTIIAPIPGSPAEAAGLLPGDKIIAVDGDDMTGIDGNLVIRRVVGPAGADVSLTIRREGIEDFEITITRAEIIVPSIDGRILEGTDIAYIQLFSFG